MNMPVYSNSVVLVRRTPDIGSQKKMDCLRWKELLLLIVLHEGHCKMKSNYLLVVRDIVAPKIKNIILELLCPSV